MSCLTVRSDWQHAEHRGKYGLGASNKTDPELYATIRWTSLPLQERDHGKMRFNASSMVFVRFVLQLLIIWCVIYLANHVFLVN